MVLGLTLYPQFNSLRAIFGKIFWCKIIFLQWSITSCGPACSLPTFIFWPLIRFKKSDSAFKCANKFLEGVNSPRVAGTCQIRNPRPRKPPWRSLSAIPKVFLGWSASPLSSVRESDWKWHICLNFRLNTHRWWPEIVYSGRTRRALSDEHKHLPWNRFLAFFTLLYPRSVNERERLLEKSDHPRELPINQTKPSKSIYHSTRNDARNATVATILRFDKYYES